MSSESSSIKERQIGDYLIQDLIGDGGFAKVYLGMHIPTKERVAIKIIDKEELFAEEENKKRLFLEISILKKVRHKNIIKLYEIMETPATLYLVMEYCNNGELFDYIVSKDKLTEKQACIFYQEIIDALSYLHSINIVHRDVKPENILLNTINRKTSCKLIDFGISRNFQKNELIETPCGTASYAPPEMHNGQAYNPILSESWSSGVLLFSMICGFLPFNDEDEEVNIKNILQGKYEFPEDDELSPEVMDLISHLLDINVNTRYNLEKIREHPWFNLIPPISRPGIIIGYHKIPIDDNILKQCVEFGYDKDKVIESVEKNRYDKNSAVYYILLKKFEIQGIESISDLYSEKYLEYINDKDNLLTEEEIANLKKEMEKNEKEEKERELNNEFEKLKDDNSSSENIYSEKSLEEINNDNDSLKSSKEIEENKDNIELKIITDKEIEEEKKDHKNDDEKNIKNNDYEDINMGVEMNISDLYNNKYMTNNQVLNIKEEIKKIEIKENEKEKEIRICNNIKNGRDSEENKERKETKREEIMNKIKEKIKSQKDQKKQETKDEEKENIKINGDKKDEIIKKNGEKNKKDIIKSCVVCAERKNIDNKDLSLKLRPFYSFILESKTKVLLNCEEPIGNFNIFNSSFTIKLRDNIKENILKMKNPKKMDKMANIKILKALNELNNKKVKNIKKEPKNREKKVKFLNDENILSKGKIEHTIIKNRDASVKLDRRRKRNKEEEKDKEVERENINKKNLHHSLRKTIKDKQYVKSKKIFTNNNNINIINNNKLKKSLRISKKIEFKPKEKIDNNNNNSKNNINKDEKKYNAKNSIQNFKSNKTIREPKKSGYVHLKSETNINIKNKKINTRNNMRNTITSFKSKNNEQTKGINNRISININSRNIKNSNIYNKKKTLNYNIFDKKNKDRKPKLIIENYRTLTQNIPKNTKKIQNKRNIKENNLQSYNTNDVITSRRNNSIEFRKTRIKITEENNRRNNSIELRKVKTKKNYESNLIKNKIKIIQHNRNNSKFEKSRNNKSIELRKKLGLSMRNKLHLTVNYDKNEKNKINENNYNTEIIPKKEKIKIDKNLPYKGPLGFKNLFISESIEFIQNKIENSLKLNQIKFRKINPFKFSCCTKNMDKFFIEICFVSELVIYKNSIRKNNEEEVNGDEENINIGKKYLFYIKLILSKENNDIPHCKLLEKVIDDIQIKN